MSDAMNNDTAVKGAMYEAAEAAARGDVAAASAGVAKASTDAIEKMKSNLHGEALAAAIAIGNIVKTSAASLKNVTETVQGGVGFTGPALKAAIGKSLANATGIPFVEEPRATVVDRTAGGKFRDDLTASTQGKDGNVEMRKKPFTAETVKTSMFIESASGLGSHLGQKVNQLYSFIDVAHKILSFAHAQSSNPGGGMMGMLGDSGLDFSSPEEPVQPEELKNQPVAVPPAGKSKACLLGKGCIETWTAESTDEFTKPARILSFEGLEVGTKYKVVIKGMFEADASKKSHGAVCPYVEGFGEQHAVTCPSFFTPIGNLPSNKRSLAGTDRTMQSRKRFSAAMEFTAVATSEVLELMAQQAPQYYQALGPISLKIQQISPPMKAPKIVHPVCPNNMAPDFTMAGPKCILVMIGDQSCESVEMVSSEELRCIVPPGVGKNLSVTVLTGNQSTIDIGNFERIKRLREESSHKEISELAQFSYDAPVVKDYHPKWGPVEGLNTITIFGYNFGPDIQHVYQNRTTSVTIGGRPCLNTLWLSDKEIECKAPPGIGAKREVVVRVGNQYYPKDGHECTKCNGCCKPIYYNYRGPKIHRISPNHGTTAGGDTVNIYGESFGDEYHMPTVLINDEVCPEIQWMSKTHIVCKTPSGWGEKKSVQVIVGDQPSEKGEVFFSYDNPEIFEVTPAVCRTRGNCLIKVKGLNFGHEQGEHLSLTVGGKPCARVNQGREPLFMNQTDLECVVPSGVGGGLDVKVCLLSQCSNTNDFFSYRMPEVYEIRPRHGNMKGGRTARIVGVGFGQNGFSSRIVASIGMVPCADTKWISNVELECVLPKTAVGGINLPVYVKVSNQKSVADDLPTTGYFSYDAPEIHSISLSTGATKGGYWMNMEGFNFPVGAEIYFGGMEMFGADLKKCKETRVLPGGTVIRCLVPCGVSVGKDTSGREIVPGTSHTESDGAIRLSHQHNVQLVVHGRRFVQTQRKPKKKIKVCPAIPDMGGHLVKSGSRWEGGNVVTFRCETGFDLKGNGSTICNGTNGQWTNNPAKLMCLKPKAPKPDIPYDVFGLNLQAKLLQSTNLERSRSGAGEAEQYDEKAKKMKAAAEMEREAGHTASADKLDKQADQEEALAVKIAERSAGEQSKKVAAKAVEKREEVEKLSAQLEKKTGAERDQLEAKISALKKEAHTLDAQAQSIAAAGKTIKHAEPKTMAESLSKVEIAAMASRDSIHRMIQSTLKEQEIQRNSTATVRDLDRKADMIAEQKDKAQSDYEDAKRQTKEALEQQEKDAEKEMEERKKAAARAQFAAMNAAGGGAADDSAAADAMNPDLSEEKLTAAKVMRAKSKMLTHAAKLTSLTKAHQNALAKAKGKPTAEVSKTLDDLRAERARAEKTSNAMTGLEAEAAAVKAKADAKQGQVAQDTQDMIKNAELSAVDAKEIAVTDRLKNVEAVVADIEARLPEMNNKGDAASFRRAELEAEIASVKAKLVAEVSKPGKSKSVDTILRLEKKIIKLADDFKLVTTKETELKEIVNGMRRASENLTATRNETDHDLADLSLDRDTIHAKFAAKNPTGATGATGATAIIKQASKLRRRLLMQAAKSNKLLRDNKMRFAARSEYAGDLINVLQSFNFATGELVEEFFDTDSIEGRYRDPDMFYTLKGGMQIDIAFDYKQPEVTRAYHQHESKAHGKTDGTDRIVMEGTNFGCVDLTTSQPDTGFNLMSMKPKALQVGGSTARSFKPVTSAKVSEGLKRQTLTAWMKTAEATDRDKWIKCAKTIYESDGKLVCETPAGSGTKIEMKVTLGGEESAPKKLFDYDKPIVTRIEQYGAYTMGRPEGKNWVAIHGFNFGPTRPTWGMVKPYLKDLRQSTYETHSAIKIGDVYCIKSRWVSDTEVRCLAPPGIPNTNHTVTVGPVNGQYSDAAQDRVFYAYGRPFVRQSVPSIGSGKGNQTIRIIGKNFGDCVTYQNYDVKNVIVDKTLHKYCPDVTAYVDCQKCLSTVRVSNTMVECVTPGGVGAGKFLDVQVGADKVGVRRDSNNAFSYNQAVITKVVPNHGPAEGGNTVVMHGYNFGISQEDFKKGCYPGRAPSVMVGHIDCASVNIESDKKLTCVMSGNPGVGKRLPLTPRIGGLSRSSPVTEDASYSFDLPVVKSVHTSNSKTQVVSPSGYDWVFACNNKDGNCQTPDQQWVKHNSYLVVEGNNFGSREYYYSGHHYRGRITCGFGNVQGNAQFVSNTKMNCHFPQNDQNRLVAEVGLASARVWVKVAQQKSFVPDEPKPDTYDLTFLKYPMRDLQGTPMQTITGGVDKCIETCKQAAGCGAFTIDKGDPGKCNLYSKTATVTCGTSAQDESAVTTYISEGIGGKSTGECIAPNNIAMGMHVESVLPTQAMENSDAMLTIKGKNFGAKGSVRAKSLKAYYAGEECLSTEYVSNEEIKCKPTQKPRSVGEIAMQDSFENKAGYNSNQWLVVSGGKVGSLTGKSCGAAFGNAMQFASGGSITTKPLNLLKGAKLEFKMSMCGDWPRSDLSGDNWHKKGSQSWKNKDAPKGVSLSASVNGGKTWFEVADYNTYHSTRGWHTIQFKLFNSEKHGDHPAAAGNVMLKWEGKHGFAIDEVKITSDAVAYPVRVSGEVMDGRTKLKTMTTKSQYLGLELATVWSVPPNYRATHTACTTGPMCKSPASATKFPGFKWFTDGLDDPVWTSMVDCASSSDASPSTTECMKAFAHDGKKTSWVHKGVGKAWISVEFEGEASITQVRLTHVDEKEAKSKKLCLPKEIVIEHSTGTEVVSFANADKKNNAGIGYSQAQDIKRIVAKRVTIVIKSVQNSCSLGNIGIGQIELRGAALRNVVGSGSFSDKGLKQCSGDSYNLGRHGDGFWAKHNYEWNCYKAFNGKVGAGEGNSWATLWPYSTSGKYNGRPTSKPAFPQMTLELNAPKDVYSINMRQRRGYHAKQVVLTMKDKTGKTVATEKISPADKDGALQNFNLGSIRSSISTVKVQIMDLFKSTVRQPIPYMYDTFKTESSSNWIFPKKAGYDYGAKNGLWFSGDAENKVPIYSKYPWPAMGTTITGEITGDPGKCSDHFIMLSTKPQKDWSMGSSEDAIKFAWNCDELSIFPMGKSKIPAITTGCRAASREQKFQIQIEQGSITFYSTGCRESASSINGGTRTKQLSVSNSFATKEGAASVYIYIGASQDRKQVTKKPTFKFVKFVTAGLGLQELEIVGKDSN
jgi:hypothetical protein